MTDLDFDVDALRGTRPQLPLAVLVPLGKLLLGVYSVTADSPHDSILCCAHISHAAARVLSHESFHA